VLTSIETPIDMAAAAPDVPRPKRMSPAARRLAREMALQGLYQWMISGNSSTSIDAHMREQAHFRKCDAVHFDALLHGCINHAAALDEALALHLDRKPSELSPVEHSVLMIGAYELQHCLDVPYRVAINEAVELAKVFGGAEGHRYVNGVLDKVALDSRALEVNAFGRGTPKA
jgi:transcription antitermination protein NusB